MWVLAHSSIQCCQMNERVPDSTGLPLRAMVMVLLCLGVIFFCSMGFGLGIRRDH